ncbi:MAG: IS256 family transposase [Thiothrix sp.]
MDRTELQAIAKELAKTVKTETDLNLLSQQLLKMTVEAALNAELDDHLGYAKHSKSPATGNSRNGRTRKTLKGQHGEVEIETPRDRNGSFEPLLVKKNQTRLTRMDDQILYLYAKGMSTRDIVDSFQEMYGADVSPTLVSNVTAAVIDKVTEWQSRPLDPIYPILYLDALVVKIRKGKQVINQSVYLVLGVTLEGHKELLGMWLSDTEGAKFWLGVLTDLQNRGVQDVLIACVDGLSGFPEAINAVFPQTDIQLCIVHMVRNSLKYVPWKDYRAVTADLKEIYQSSTEEQGKLALRQFGERWDNKYPQISRSWTEKWENLNTFFAYPADIRKAIYTTNAIESLNSVVRKAVKKRKVFPNEDSAKKVLFLAMQQASRKWTMPIRDWKAALNRFMILFEDRLKGFV